MTSDAYEQVGVGWQIHNLVLGKMTPVLQLTDTDQSFVFKNEARKAKEAMLSDLKAKCRQTGIRENFRCSHCEILKIVHDSLRGLVERTDQLDLILGGLRRNWMLVWRSDMEMGRMVKSESHRIHRSWMRDRHSLTSKKTKARLNVHTSNSELL